MTELKFDKSSVIYRKLLAYILPFWPMLVLGIAANVFYSGIDATFTYLLRPFLNKGFIDKDLEFVSWIPLIILVGITMRGSVSAIGGYAMTSVARSVVKSVRQTAFKHIINLPVSYYEKATSGQLLSKILYDVEQVAQVSADALTTLVQSICLVIGLLVVMFLINWQLSALFLATVPFVGAIVNITNKKTRKVSHKVQQTMGEVTEIAGEAIDGYKVVRIYGGHDYEIDKFNQATERSRKSDMKVALIKAVNVAGVQFVIALGIAMIILAAIKLSTVITITAGGFLSIIAAMLQLIKPLKNLTTVTSTIQRGLAGAESIFRLLDESIETDQGKVNIDKTRGQIEFDKVNFGYDSSKQPVLSNLSFKIQPGQTVALVGHSGSGKSTIANLIPRFYEVNQGRVLIDGHCVKSFELANLRQQIAFVSQEVTLFNDTLANNIAYGNESYSRQAIENAAKLAYAKEFIDKLPQGFDTIVGEQGLLLSGGQRQRIAIARALLKDAPILILDEATSALDAQSERYIQKALENVTKGRTTLIIAHRLSTIEKADTILVISQGQIVEQGSHLHLLTQNGYYAALYQDQSSKNYPLIMQQNELCKDEI